MTHDTIITVPIGQTVEPGTAITVGITVGSSRSVPLLEDTPKDQRQQLVLEQIQAERLALLKNVKNLAAESVDGEIETGNSSLFEPSDRVEPDQVQSEPEWKDKSWEEVGTGVRPEDLITGQQEQGDSSSPDSLFETTSDIDIAVQREKADNTAIANALKQVEQSAENKAESVQVEEQATLPKELEQLVEPGSQLASDDVEQLRSHEVEQGLVSDTTNDHANELRADSVQQNGLLSDTVEQGGGAQGNCPAEKVELDDANEQLRPEDSQQGDWLSSDDVQQVAGAGDASSDDINEKVELDDEGDRLKNKPLKLAPGDPIQFGHGIETTGDEVEQGDQFRTDQADEVEQGEVGESDVVQQGDSEVVDHEETDQSDDFDVQSDEVERGDQLETGNVDQSDEVEQGDLLGTGDPNQSDEVEQGDQLKTSEVDQSDEVELLQAGDVGKNEVEVDENDEVEQGDQLQTGGLDKNEVEVDQNDPLQTEVDESDEVDQGDVDQSIEVGQGDQLQTVVVNQGDEVEEGQTEEVEQGVQLQTEIEVDQGDVDQNNVVEQGDQLEVDESDEVDQGDVYESNEAEQGDQIQTVVVNQGGELQGQTEEVDQLPTEVDESDEVDQDDDVDQSNEVEQGEVEQEQDEIKQAISDHIEIEQEAEVEHVEQRVESDDVDVHSKGEVGSDESRPSEIQLKSDEILVRGKNYLESDVEQDNQLIRNEVEKDLVDSQLQNMQDQVKPGNQVCAERGLTNGYTTTMCSAAQCHVLPMRRAHFSELEPVFFGEQNPQLPIGHRPVRAEDPSQAIGDDRQPVPWAPPASSSAYATDPTEQGEQMYWNGPAADPTEQGEQMYNVMWNGPADGMPHPPPPPPPPQQGQDGQCLDQAGENAYYQSYYTLFVPTPYYTYTVIPK